MKNPARNSVLNVADDGTNNKKKNNDLSPEFRVDVSSTGAIVKIVSCPLRFVGFCAAPRCRATTIMKIIDVVDQNYMKRFYTFTFCPRNISTENPKFGVETSTSKKSLVKDTSWLRQNRLDAYKDDEYLNYLGSTHEYIFEVFNIFFYGIRIKHLPFHFSGIFHLDDYTKRVS